MSDFRSDQYVASIRKPRRCEACLLGMQPGEPAWRSFGVHDGDVFNCYLHPECRVAEDELNDLIDDYWGEWTPLHEMGEFYWRWLFNHHPIAAERYDLKLFLQETERREADQ
jgi:hypothetical protein